MPIKGKQTAREFIAELDADPVMREARQRTEAAVRERQEASRVAQAPLLADLRNVGIDVSTVWLLYKAAPYAAAIPILLSHFERPYPAEVRDGIARALAVREAAWAWDRLVTLLFREPMVQGRNVRFALALAVAGAAPKGSLDKLLELIRDPSLGTSRLAFVRPLLRSRNPRALQTLEELRDDPDLTKELQFRLGMRAKRLQRRSQAPRKSHSS